VWAVYPNEEEGEEKEIKKRKEQEDGTEDEVEEMKNIAVPTMISTDFTEWKRIEKYEETDIKLNWRKVELGNVRRHTYC